MSDKPWFEPEFAAPSPVPGMIELAPLDGGAPMTVRPEHIREIVPVFSGEGVWIYCEIRTAFGTRKVNACLEQIGAAVTEMRRLTYSED